MSNLQDSGKVTNVSDTAILTATYRAMETNRKDALFHDPYAELLTGDRGKKIVESLEPGKSGAWATATRTVAFDEMIMRAVKEGATTVINLAAGLDTRPYRLPLSPSLRWIEVDLPDIMAYKTKMLADKKAKCSLERISMDLADHLSRKKLFDRIDQEGGKVLVVAEGLLMYLKKDDVISLAEDLHREEHFHWWIADVITPRLHEAMKNSFKERAAGDVYVEFALEEGPGFFAKYGWKATAAQTMSEEGRRLKREPYRPWALNLARSIIPKKILERHGKMDSYFFFFER